MPTDSQFFFLEGLNPEPWTAPEGSIGRANGKLYVQMHKSATLDSFQRALKAELGNYDTKMYPASQLVYLKLWLWRNLHVYESDKGKKVRRHAADATNMQKAVEDALQGVLFKNDNQVLWVQTHVVEQGPEVQPCIVIEVGTMNPTPPLDRSGFRHKAVPRHTAPEPAAQTHSHPEDIF